MSSTFQTDDSPAGAFESIAVSTSAIGPTVGTIIVPEAGGTKKRAWKAFLTVETNSIRVRWDGTDPSSSVGHLLTSGSSLTVTGEFNVQRLKMIRASADATVMVTYYFNR